MGTRLHSERIGEALFGDVRRAVLGVLFVAPDEPLYVREIIRRSGVGQGSVQRELARLSRAGLIVREERGNLVYYRPDTEAPVYAEIRGLVLKTSGLADVLRSALEPLSKEVDLAFVYGSIASGVATAASDVDILVVGDVDGMALHRSLRDAGITLGRPVNYQVMSLREFRSRIDTRESFVARILEAPRIDIVGSLVDV